MAQPIDLSQLGDVLRQAKVDPAKAKTRFLKGARQILIAETKKCFDEGRSPDGTAWPALKHKRIRGDGTPKPLRDTGLLMASVTSASNPNHVEREEGSSLVFGTNAIQAGVHQYGGEIKPKNKYLTIPVSIEAFRAGSPLRFPDADKRLRWAVGANGGIVYEVLKGKKKLMKKKKGINSIYTKVKDEDVIIHFYASTGVVIPARPFLGITSRTVDKLAKLAESVVQK